MQNKQFSVIVLLAAIHTLSPPLEANHVLEAEVRGNSAVLDLPGNQPHTCKPGEWRLATPEEILDYEESLEAGKSEQAETAFNEEQEAKTPDPNEPPVGDTPPSGTVNTEDLKDVVLVPGLTPSRRTNLGEPVTPAPVTGDSGTETKVEALPDSSDPASVGNAGAATVAPEADTTQQETEDDFSDKDVAEAQDLVDANKDSAQQETATGETVTDEVDSGDKTEQTTAEAEAGTTAEQETDKDL